MSDEPNTPLAPATGTPGNPATGTTSQGAKPTVEELQLRISELERHANNKTEEAGRHHKNLSEAQKKLAEYEEKERLAQEAQLSEVEKSKKLVEAEKAARVQAEQQIQQLRQQLVMSEVKLAAKSMDFINPELVAKVIELEYDENGMPTNLTKALEDLAKSNPFLLKAKEEQRSAEQITPAQTANNQQAPRTPAMNPGRSQISAPSQLPPGQIVRFNDVFKRQ
jgi:multidrug efflux pump subunit AcrA (membrane-fusion protein)